MVPANSAANCTAWSFSRRDVDPKLLEKYQQGHERSVVLDALESVEFPESRRRNVRQLGDDHRAMGMCLGMTECYVRGPVVSRSVRDRPCLALLLCLFARRELPGFDFTSIQVNKDYAAALHVDRNDAGDSRIIGLGDYVGGQLWLDDGSHGGCGRVADLRDQWLGFDGNLPHKVLPFSGRRYTIVFFSRLRGGDVGARPETPEAQQLHMLGFPLPPKMPTCRTYIPAEERLRIARTRFERFCAYTYLRGGAGRRLRLEVSAVRRLRSAVLTLQTPMQSLCPGFNGEARHMGDGMQSRMSPCSQVAFALGRLPLLPSDTATDLGMRCKEAMGLARFRRGHHAGQVAIRPSGFCTNATARERSPRRPPPVVLQVVEPAGAARRG